MQSARQLILKSARRTNERTSDMYQKVRLADSPSRFLDAVIPRSVFRGSERVARPRNSSYASFRPDAGGTLSLARPACTRGRGRLLPAAAAAANASSLGEAAKARGRKEDEREREKAAAVSAAGVNVSVSTKGDFSLFPPPFPRLK